MTLSELADAVEGLEGPSMKHDILIENACVKPTGQPKKWLALKYTSSIDAAMTLVPEDSLFTVRTVWDKMKPAGFGSVSRYEKGKFGGHERLYWMDEHQSVAATPALALTVAALRARARASGEGA